MRAGNDRMPGGVHRGPRRAGRIDREEEGVSENASLTAERRVGGLTVVRPTLETVAVIARELRGANIDVDGFLATAGRDDGAAASEGVKLLLGIAERLSPILRTVVRRNGERLTVEEMSDIPADAALDLICGAVALLDREAVQRLRDRVLSLSQTKAMGKA